MGLHVVLKFYPKMKEQKQAAASLEVSCRLCHEDLLCRDAGQGQTQKEMLQKFEDLHKRRMEARQKYSELEEMLAVKVRYGISMHIRSFEYYAMDMVF